MGIEKNFVVRALLTVALAGSGIQDSKAASIYLSGFNFFPYTVAPGDIGLIGYLFPPFNSYENLSTLTNQGAISNAGALTNGIGAWLDNQNGAALYNLSEFSNRGQITNAGLVQQSGNLNISAAGAFENQAGGTLNNPGNVLNYGVISNGGIINNDNTLSMRIGVDLDSPINYSGRVTNQSTGQINNNATWSIGSFTTLENIGSFKNIGSMSNDSLVTNTGTFNQYGIFDNNNQATFRNTGGTLNNTGYFYNNGGATMDIGLNSPVVNSGTFRNFSLVANGSFFYNDYGAVLTNESGAVLENRSCTGSIYLCGIVNSGTLLNYGGAILRIPGGTNLGISNTGYFGNKSGATLQNQGGFLSNSGSLVNEGGAVLQNGGLLINANMLFNLAGGTLDNQAGGTISNSIGSFFNYGLVANSGQFRNTEFGAVFHNESGATFQNRSGGTFDNQKTLENKGGALLENQFGATLNNYDQLLNRGTLSNAGFIRNFASMTNEGQLNNNATLWNESTGTLRNQPGATFNLAGGLANQGGTVVNSGQFNVNTFLAFNNSGATLQNQAGGTLVVSAFNNVNNAGAIGNAGQFTIDPLGQVQGTGTYTQTAGETRVNGLLQASAIDIQGGVVKGNGDLQGTVTVGAGASVDPGLSPGSLTITGDLILGGTLNIEFGELAFDTLTVTGNADFTNGIVNLDFIGGFVPAAGSVYDWLNVGGSLIGLNPSRIHVNGLPENVRYDFVGLDFRLITIDEPATGPLLFLGLGMIGMCSWRRRWI